jgi:hypothetical protein
MTDRNNTPSNEYKVEYECLPKKEAARRHENIRLTVKTVGETANSIARAILVSLLGPTLVVVPLLVLLEKEQMAMWLLALLAVAYAYYFGKYVKGLLPRKPPIEAERVEDDVDDA